MNYDYSNYVVATYEGALNETLNDFKLRWRALTDRICPAQGMRVLDVGGGSGQLAAVLGDEGCIVSLLDISEEGVAFARKVCRKTLTDDAFARMTFVVGDLTKGSQVAASALEEKKFDVIILTEVWEHLNPAQCQTLLEVFHSLLKPGGKVYITTSPNRIFARIMRGAWRIVFGRLGGYHDQGIHINEQSYWSLKKALSSVPGLRFTVGVTYPQHWLYYEAKNVFVRRPGLKWMLPIAYLGSSSMNAIYLLFGCWPWFRRLICRGFLATGEKLQV